MVQILPPKFNVGTQIGNALGGGLQQGMQQGIQRGMLQQALGKVRGLAESGAKPLDLMLGLMEAGAGIPGSERYLGPLLQPLLQAAQAQFLPDVGKNTSTALPDSSNLQGSINQGEQINNQGISQQQAQPSSQQSPQNAIADRVPSASGLPLQRFLPMDLGELISPEQRSQIVKNVISTGGDPNLAKQYIDEYNQGKITINDLINKNVDRSFVNTQRQRQLESNALSFINTQLGDKELQPFKNVAYGMLTRELQKSPYEDLTPAWQNISNEFANFKKEYERFQDAIPTGNILGMNNKTIDQLERRAKSILKKDPLAYNVLEEAFKSKGQSIVSAAQVLNKLPESVSKITNDVKDYSDELYPKFLLRDISDKEMTKNIDRIETEQTDQLPKIEKQIVKNWSPTLSLINIYANLRKKGWTHEVINLMMKNLENQVEFSPQQAAEATQLVKAPKIPPNFLLK